MSGTPTISDHYAVAGRASAGAGRSDPGVTLVLLMRSPRPFRAPAAAEACRWGFTEVLAVEEGPGPRGLGALVSEEEGLRVLVPLGTPTVGERINWAAREVRTDKFLVLWDDQGPPEGGPWGPRLGRLAADREVLAWAPRLADRTGETLPTAQIPGLEGPRLKILGLASDEENVETLFPADFTALYDRRRFLATGGFDPLLTRPFWQRTDWGLRAHLWGETIRLTKSFSAVYRSAPPAEDQGSDAGALRVWLRNLAVRHNGDHGVLPWSRLPAHLWRSGGPWADAWRSFVEARRWVETHRYRFVTDAGLLAELWGRP